MLQYHFVRCPLSGEDGYQHVVHQLAGDGWRLVQVLIEQPATMTREVVLVCERPTESSPPTVGRSVRT